ncbi:MAG: DUF1595 domain-containing protein, partial [Verrucomicrobiota bacterium]
MKTKRFARNQAFIGLTLSALLCSPAAATPSKLSELRPFLKQHCFDCHGPEKQKGDIRLDTLGDDLTQHTTLEIWQGVLDQLNLGDMPPAKRPRPEQKDVEATVETLTRVLQDAYAKARSTDGQTVLRRLNRHELRNTFRDLLYLNGADFRPDVGGSRLVDNNGNGSVSHTGTDPLRFFPEDEEDEGFTNLGDTLIMSDFYLNLVLDAVEEVLAYATHLEPKPRDGAHHFARHIVKGRRNGEHPIEAVAREIHPDFDMLVTGYDRYGRVMPTELRGGVSFSARRRIRVDVSAHNPDHPWGDVQKLRDKDPFQFCLNIADTKNRGIEGGTSTRVAQWAVPPDGKKYTYTHDVWLDRFWTIWVGWENGPVSREFRAERVVEKFMPDAFFPRPDKKADKEGHDNWPKDMARLLLKDGYAGPHVRLHSLSIEPIIETWPPRSHTALYGSGTGEEAEIRQLMTRFAERAFRRPVTQTEVEPYIQLVLQQRVEPVVTVAGGIQNLTYAVYEGEWTKLPDFDAIKPVAEGTLPTGYIDIKPL